MCTRWIPFDTKATVVCSNRLWVVHGPALKDCIDGNHAEDSDVKTEKRCLSVTRRQIQPLNVRPPTHWRVTYQQVPGTKRRHPGVFTARQAPEITSWADTDLSWDLSHERLRLHCGVSVSLSCIRVIKYIAEVFFLPPPRIMSSSCCTKSLSTFRQRLKTHFFSKPFPEYFLNIS